MTPGTTIFEHMSGLARVHGAVNLGQGFPDFGWPEEVVAAAAAALTGQSSQYPPMRGLPALREAVADHYRAHQAIDAAADEVIVTSGATEALAAAMLALIAPGDEVVLFEPLYDSYLPIVRRAGGVPRLARLAPPDWRITRDMLDAVFTPRTRLVLFNNPNNPAAVVHGADELELLASACVENDVIALCDEVWEHVRFDGRPHLPLISFPGMRERTIKIGSAGKIFSLTGWKVGWLLAAAPLAERVARSHQFLTFTTPPNLQAGVAFGLGMPGDYFTGMRDQFQRARDRLAARLADAGYVPLASQGTYFLSVDLPASGIGADDVTFCERAVRDAGVAAIPGSAFYAGDPPRGIVRLCFAKSEATIDAGLAGLERARALF